MSDQTSPELSPFEQDQLHIVEAATDTSYVAMLGAAAFSGAAVGVHAIARATGVEQLDFLAMTYASLSVGSVALGCLASVQDMTARYRLRHSGRYHN